MHNFNFEHSARRTKFISNIFNFHHKFPRVFYTEVVVALVVCCRAAMHSIWAYGGYLLCNGAPAPPERHWVGCAPAQFDRHRAGHQGRQINRNDKQNARAHDTHTHTHAHTGRVHDQQTDRQTERKREREGVCVSERARDIDTQAAGLAGTCALSPFWGIFVRYVRTTQAQGGGGGGQPAGRQRNRQKKHTKKYENRLENTTKKTLRQVQRTRLCFSAWPAAEAAATAATEAATAAAKKVNIFYTYYVRVCANVCVAVSLRRMNFANVLYMVR